MTLSCFQLVIIYVFTNSTSRILQRYVIKDEEVDPTAFSAFWHLMSGVIGIPFILTAPIVFPHHIKIWLIAILSGALYTTCLLLYFKALKITEISQTETIATTRSIWIMLLGAIFFGEILTASKIIGVALIFTGLVVVYCQKIKNPSFGRHHIYVLIYSILISCAYALDKYALGYFSVAFYNVLLYILPGTFTLAVYPKALKKIRCLIKPKKNNYLIILSCSTQIVSSLSLYAAYKVGELSVIGPLAQTSSVLTIIFGIALLKERWNLKRKIAGIAIVFTGVIFLRFLVF